MTTGADGLGPPDRAADPLAEVRAEIRHGRWVEALGLLDEPVAGADPAESLELRAEALYAVGRFEASVEAWEARCSLAAAQGQPLEAARAAAMVAMFLMIDSGLMAPVRGWLRRAEGFVEGHDEAPARALIALVRTYERFMCGDLAGAREQARLSIELGERLEVPAAVVIGRVAGARIRIFEGAVAEGLEQLDEIAVVLMSGEVDPLTTGMMYCELICAAQGLGLYDRASEWTVVMDRWRSAGAVGGIGGRCRVHRAEMLRISGPCDRAEEEALRACEELRPWMRREFGWPLVELGNARLRRGDLEGAESAYLAAHQHAWSPHPGLAQVRLARGDVAGASALIANAIAHPVDIPSKERPPIGDLRLAPLLDAQVEIAAAAGDLQTARRAAASLAKIAAAYPGPGLEASAALADARAALLEADVERAIGSSGRAVATWAALGAPFDAAVARTVLASALERAGNPEGARVEWEAALSAFVSFGAQGWAERLEARTSSSRAGSGAEPARRRATFQCAGELRTVRFGELAVVVRDMKGFRYVERLLAEPAREFHVLDLVAGERGTSPADEEPLGEGGGGVLPDGAGLAIFDEQARSAYRRRLAEVDEDIEDAGRANDLGRLELAQRDREYLMGELARAVGLGGRLRSSGSIAERARTSVTRSIRYALRRLGAHHPTVSGHLGRCVRTGTFCSYQPDPVSPVDWEL